MSNHCTPKNLLENAKGLLTERDHWTQHTWAKADGGLDLDEPWWDDAGAYCAIGALAKVAYDCELFNEEAEEGEPGYLSMEEHNWRTWPEQMREAIVILSSTVLDEFDAAELSDDQHAGEVIHWNDNVADHEVLLKTFDSAIKKAS